jgi:outer membrane protein assembly factor BamB
MLTVKLKWVLLILSFFFLIQFYGVTNSNASAPASTSITKLWSFRTTGSVYGSPAIANGCVYASSSFIWGAIGNIYCLNASTGTQIWNHTVGTYLYTGLTVANGIVYTNGLDVFFALNASTGAEVWNITGPIGLPVVANNRLYLTGYGIYCLNPFTGARIWNYSTEGAVGQAVVIEGYVFANGRANKEYPSQGGVVYCLNAFNGEKIWNYSTPEMTGTPVTAGDSAYVCAINVSVSNNPTDFDGAVYALEASTGAKIWSHSIGRFSSDNPNFVPVVAGNIVYVSVGNKTFALDASTGDERWTFTSQYPVSSPLFLNSYVYVTSDAIVYCLDASTGTVKWTYAIESEASSPIISGGNVYVGSTGSSLSIYNNAYAIDAYTGKKIWNYTVEGEAGYFAVAGGIVYVGSYKPGAASGSLDADGAIYALKPLVTSPSPSTALSVWQLIVIVVVVVIAILAILLLVYKIRRKGAKSPPSAQPLPKP